MSLLTHTLAAVLLATTLAACQRDAPSGREEAAPPTAASEPAVDSPRATPSPSSSPPAGNGLEAGQRPSTIEIPPADTPTPDIAAGAQISYTCEDGSELHVVYSAHSAKFALVDGSVATLPRAESASKGGGDVYVSDTVALQRLGNVVQVEEPGGTKRVCAESGGNA